MALNGWFPCFSPSGDHVLTGAGELWIDQTQLVGPGYQGRWGGNSLWTSEHTALYMLNVSGTAYGIYSVSVGGRSQDLSLPYGFNEFAVAQGGRWAGWAGGPSALVGVQTSWGTTVTGARGPAINSTRLAYILDWTGTIPNQRLMLDGVLVDTAPIINVMMTEDALCWTRMNGPLGAEPWGMRLDVPSAPQSLQASDVMEFCAIPIDAPGGPWVLSYENTRLLLRPWGSTDGYVVATGENATLYPAGVYHVATGTFRIGWSDAQGVYGERYIDPTETRVALGGTAIPGSPSWTWPGNPGAAGASASYPPVRHPISDQPTNVVTTPWAAWFQKQSELVAANDYSAMPASTLLGRGSTGPGFAAAVDLGAGLVMRENTLYLDLTDILANLIRYGLRADQPDAATVPIGTLYGVSDEAVIERSNGTTWDPFGSV